MTDDLPDVENYYNNNETTHNDDLPDVYPESYSTTPHIPEISSDNNMSDDLPDVYPTEDYKTNNNNISTNMFTGLNETRTGNIQETQEDHHEELLPPLSESMPELSTPAPKNEENTHNSITENSVKNTTEKPYRTIHTAETKQKDKNSTTNTTNISEKNTEKNNTTPSTPSNKTFDNIDPQKIFEYEKMKNNDTHLENFTENSERILLDDGDDRVDLPAELSKTHEWGENIVNIKENTKRSERKLDEILSHSIDYGASDVYVRAGDFVVFKRNDRNIRINRFDIMNSQDTRLFTDAALTSVQETSFAKDYEIDASYVIRSGKYKGRRARINIGRENGSNYLIFRNINDTVKKPSEYGIPTTVEEWFNRPKGLVLVNGPTGTGKSTTLASLLKQKQLHTRKTIMTIEKPVEFEYGNEGKAVVIQREVGKDTKSFSKGLDSAMRSAPDIILVGEVRNAEEVDALLRAAETGHLSVSTMHTESAALTIQRIKGLYSGEEQQRVLLTLAEIGRGFVNQALLEDAEPGENGRYGRFAVYEVLDFTEEVSELVQKGDVRGLRQYQMENKITLEHQIAKAIQQNRCTLQTGLDATVYPKMIEKILQEEF